MEKFHSTLSRRDFMKGLGLIGAGLGGAAALAPALTDLDSCVSAGAAYQGNHPWWVKERDYLNPTTEIDWDVLKKPDMTKYQQSLFPYFSPEVANKHKAISIYSIYGQYASGEGSVVQGVRVKDWNNAPGYTLRDWALWESAASYTAAIQKDEFGNGFSTFLGDYNLMKEVLTPTQCGVPNWSATPEENARMIITLARFFGFTTVKFLPMEEKTQRLVYKGEVTRANQPFIFEDVDQPYQTLTKRVIPKSNTYGIVLSNVGLKRLYRTGPNYFASAKGNYQCPEPANSGTLKMMRFLKGLGYWGCSGDEYIGNIPYPAVGTLSGHGEMTRTSYMLSANLDNYPQATRLIITNLPLPVDNPVDVGVQRFCLDCRQCCNACPTGAISKDREPYWEVPKDTENSYNDRTKYNFPGKRVYFLNYAQCMLNWSETDSFCGLCQGTCVFNKDNLAGLHEVVKPIVANTGIFNSFFTSMDGFFGFGNLGEEEFAEKFWDMQYKMPVYGSEWK